MNLLNTEYRIIIFMRIWLSIQLYYNVKESPYYGAHKRAMCPIQFKDSELQNAIIIKQHILTLPILIDLFICDVKSLVVDLQRPTS